MTELCSITNLYIPLYMEVYGTIDTACRLMVPDAWAEKFGSLEQINLISETNGSFDSCSSCKRLETSRLHELHESKLPLFHVPNLFVTNFQVLMLMYAGWSMTPRGGRPWPGHGAINSTAHHMQCSSIIKPGRSKSAYDSAYDCGATFSADRLYLAGPLGSIIQIAVAGKTRPPFCIVLFIRQWKVAVTIHSARGTACITASFMQLNEVDAIASSNALKIGKNDRNIVGDVRGHVQVKMFDFSKATGLALNNDVGRI